MKVSRIDVRIYYFSTKLNLKIALVQPLYCPQGSTHTQHKDFKAWEFRGSIKGLIPGKTYVFRIQAETRVGYGPEAIWKDKMPILGNISSKSLR